MSNLTKVVESTTDVYDLQSHHDGFWTTPMAQCCLVLVFWGSQGLRYGAGRAQHCSGGLGALQFDELFKDLDSEGSGMVVLVKGVWFELSSGEQEILKNIQGKVRDNNWSIKEFIAPVDNIVVTRKGELFGKSEYDSGVNNPADNIAKCRCVIL
jgi:hypothetical protein